MRSLLDIDIQDTFHLKYENEHPIFFFAHKGELVKIKDLFAKDSQITTIEASNGATQLLYAAQAGHKALEPVTQDVPRRGISFLYSTSLALILEAF